MEAKGGSNVVHFIVDRKESHPKQGTDKTFKTTPTMPFPQTQPHLLIVLWALNSPRNYVIVEIRAFVVNFSLQYLSLTWLYWQQSWCDVMKEKVQGKIASLDV